MSTVKSSSENLTLNADGVGSNVVIQNNGTETVRVDDSGTVTATSLTADTLTNQDIQLCKAWVNFNGTGTVAIRDSYNVSSITDNGTGDYTVNFAQAMADTNYVPSILGTTYSTTNYTTSLTLLGSVSTGATLKSINALRVVYGTVSQNPTVKYDATECNVQIFGN